jgi:hypothetical protein
MYWSGAVQHSWNYDYKRYFIYDPTQPTRSFTQNWDDTGLHEAWLKKAPLDEAFFRESTKPLPQPADRSFWEATAAVIGGLTLNEHLSSA